MQQLKNALQEALKTRPPDGSLVCQEDEIRQLQEALSAACASNDELQTAIQDLTAKVQDNVELVTRLAGSASPDGEPLRTGDFPAIVDALATRIRFLEDAAADARADAGRKSDELQRLRDQLVMDTQLISQWTVCYMIPMMNQLMSKLALPVIPERYRRHRLQLLPA